MTILIIMMALIAGAIFYGFAYLDDVIETDSDVYSWLNLILFTYLLSIFVVEPLLFLMCTPCLIRDNL